MSVAREYHTQQVHYLRKGVTYEDDGSEVTVGWIPEGALILKPLSGVHVVTAFNAGSSNVIDIGADTGNDDPDDYMTDGALGTAGTFVALDETAGVFVATAATKVTASVALGGTAASTGEAEVVICYIPDNDG
ncbi:hypothetical protein [Pseudohoeflea coraliihabitans]|uniref:Uncharacterized protein n=1 Tax=Pseudohoeflea coraliihabitans TaxID=2860393 RepID=A0ABS6WUB8_9HYPH|nr:hypothetical protein [Pseudohoeflea sp. DP4N28-3]MBW3099228.1 hypothetical protein [Pseudohoeflea sp. DP4N28-3]